MRIDPALPLAPAWQGVLRQLQRASSSTPSSMRSACDANPSDTWHDCSAATEPSVILSVAFFVIGGPTSPLRTAISRVARLPARRTFVSSSANRARSLRRLRSSTGIADSRANWVCPVALLVSIDWFVHLVKRRSPGSQPRDCLRLSRLCSAEKTARIISIAHQCGLPENPHSNRHGSSQSVERGRLVRIAGGTRTAYTDARRR